MERVVVGGIRGNIGWETAAGRFWTPLPIFEPGLISSHDQNHSDTLRLRERSVSGISAFAPVPHRLRVVAAEQ